MTTAAPRVVLVTGAASGIGRGIAARFAQNGDHVALWDRSPAGEASAQALRQAGGEAAFYAVDVGVRAQVEDAVAAVVARWGGIDVLCNNAGIERYHRADEWPDEEWDAVLDTNLRGPFLCTRACFPHLQQRRGCVVHVASVQGVANEPGVAAYVASKAGLLGLVRAMAIDFAPLGVRVNGVCPGPVESGMMQAFLNAQPDPAAAHAALSAQVPLGRLGRPEDVAAAVAFLASSEASFITGATLTVDGGVLARLPLS